MISKTIHTVNRFIPFLFALFCVSVFSPSIAHAYNVEYTTVTPVNNTLSGGYFGTTDPLADWTGVGESFPYYTGNYTFYGDCGTGCRLSPTNPTAGQLQAGNAAGIGSIGSAYSFSQTYYPQSCDGPGLLCHFAISDSGQFNTGAFPNVKITGSILLFDVDSSGTVYAVTPTSSCGTYSHICGFTPENGSTVSGPTVAFTLDYFVTQEDIDQNYNDVVITLHNIDQNVLLLGFLSPGDIVLYNEVATTSAHVSFATSTPLADGNYRLEAKMQRKFFFNWITIPGDNINQSISKQFVVGTPTFIGNLTQNGFNILNGTLASSTATSSVALVANCNPLGTFDMVNCLAGLFIPDAGQVQATIQGAQQGILTRMPWGYVTRFVGIVGGTGTTTLSTTYTTTVALNTASDTTTLSFNPGDMFAGGATLVDSIASPYDGSVTFRSVFEPIIKLSIAVLVLLTIFSDITGSHAHHAEPGEVRRRRT